MKRSLTFLSVAIALCAATALSGCLETESLLPKARAIKSDQIIGQYYHEDEMKKRHD